MDAKEHPDTNLDHGPHVKGTPLTLDRTDEDAGLLDYKGPVGGGAANRTEGQGPGPNKFRPYIQRY